MSVKSVNIKEVSVTGERIPITINKDTIEFNAAAFKVKPNAVTEDLIKKLPGMEVDRAGNIKAMGEDVKKVYVDGKEFFGNDPKVATKNVPADAVDKVQVYDRKSETAMFTGIDDGTRQKTINLKLREDKKKGVFGSVMAGGGMNDHYQGNGKVYRFTDKTQLALLGMANNINQFGFSMNDYLNFNGGMGNMMNGGGSTQIRITSDGSFPINFGEPVSGMNTADAGGANFSYSTTPNNRVFMSYLGKGSTKNLKQTTESRNYVSNSTFLQDEAVTETTKSSGHNFNFGWRNRIDSTKNIILDGDFSVSNGSDDRLSNVYTNENLSPVNRMKNGTSDLSNGYSGNANLSYLQKLNHGKTVFSLTGNVNISTGTTRNQINTLTGLYQSGNWTETSKNIFQDNNTDNRIWSAGSTLTQKVAKNFYIEPEIAFGSNTESLNRTQGFPLQNNLVVDSLSPQFQKGYFWVRPKISLVHNTTKTKLTFALEMESGNLSNTLNNKEMGNVNYVNLLPYFVWEYEYQTGRRFMAMYSSGVNTPSVSQLLPIVNNINPLALFYGNPNLKPEVRHQFNAHWLIFDQFSFTSLMTTLSGSLVKNKINWDRTINNDLSFINTLTNVANDYNIRGNVDFSTPIRKLGMTIHFNWEEGWNKGLNLINKLENGNTNFRHKGSLSFDNRKKEKWDLSTGIEVTLTNSKYSLQQSLNNNYFDFSWFGIIRFNPNDKWNLELNSDITRYTSQSFGAAQTIPLLNFEVSRFLLKNKRGTLTLRGFDLLNKNRIVQRMSELNYLREIRSNSIGQFVMLSFTYRLNKFGGEGNGVVIKMKR